MAARHLQALQLEQDQVEVTVDFFEAYASFIRSPSSGVTGEKALVDAASSLRAAGQWAMLLNPERAIGLFRASARIWQRLGYGFGTFLLAAFAPNQMRRRDIANWLAQLAQPYTQDNVRLVDQERLPEPLIHPQQQAYLLLAGAGMSRRIELPREVLRIFADQSPHRRGVTPVGSLGTPLRVYWDIARRFLGRNNDQAATLVARDLAGMAASYAEAIDSAMSNQRLWFNAAAPVDVGDVDTSAIAMIAARRLGFGLTRRHLQLAANDLGPIARVPVELAIEMIERSQPGSTNTTTDA